MVGWKKSQSYTGVNRGREGGLGKIEKREEAA